MNLIERIIQNNVTLESDRLKVYPCIFNKKIIGDLWQIYSDYSNVKGYSKVYKTSREFVQTMADKILRHQNEIHGFVCYVIELKSEDKIIGLRNVILDGVYNCGNKRLDNNDNVITEIVINKLYWRHGYAEEASDLIFKYLGQMGAKNVAAFLESDNLRALSMCKKLDFYETNNMKFINQGYNRDYRILFGDKDTPRIMLKNIQYTN